MTTMTTKTLKTAFHLARTSGNLELIYAELDSAVCDILGAMRDYAEGYLYEISSDAGVRAEWAALTTRVLAEVSGSGFGCGRHGVKRALSDARASLSVIQSRA